MTSSLTATLSLVLIIPMTMVADVILKRVGNFHSLLVSLKPAKLSEGMITLDFEFDFIAESCEFQ